MYSSKHNVCGRTVSVVSDSIIESLQLDIDEECNKISILLNGISITISSSSSSSLKTNKLPALTSYSTLSQCQCLIDEDLHDSEILILPPSPPSDVKEANMVGRDNGTVSGNSEMCSKRKPVISSEFLEPPIGATVVHLLDSTDGWLSDGGSVSLTAIAHSPNVLYAGFLSIPTTIRKGDLPTNLLDFKVYPPLTNWRKPAIQCDLRLQHLFGFVGKRLVTVSVYFTSSTNLRLNFGDDQISKGNVIRLVDERPSSLLL